jgi:hypothetical protein
MPANSNTLNATMGSQLQALNAQGIEINKDYITVNLDFVNPVTNQYFDPTTFSTTILKDGNPYTDLRVMKPLSRQDDSRGVWTFSFVTQKTDGTPLDVGTYVFNFTGSATGIGPITHSITFSGQTTAQIPVEQYFVGVLRARLGDKAKRYLVDDNMRQRWTDSELYEYLDDARLDIGQTPPNPQTYDWNYMYSSTHSLLVMGGFINALMARGVFENFNKFNYNDELSLQIDRSNFFQNAQSLLASYQTSKMMWKRDKAFHDLRGGIGMASGKFPMYFSRMLSLNVSCQNTFYG